MTTPILWFALALPLLFFPIGLVLPKGAKLATFERGDWPLGWIGVVLTVDALRAGMGAWFLLKGARAIEHLLPVPPNGDEVLVGVVLAAAFAVQTLSRRNEDFVLAPGGFVGAAAIFSLIENPVVAGLALVLAVGAAMAVRAWTAFFLGLCVGIVAVGVALMSMERLFPIWLGAACAVPPLVAIMSGRQMALLRR